MPENVSHVQPYLESLNVATAPVIGHVKCDCVTVQDEKVFLLPYMVIL